MSVGDEMAAFKLIFSFFMGHLRLSLHRNRYPTLATFLAELNRINLGANLTEIKFSPFKSQSEIVFNNRSCG